MVSPSTKPLICTITRSGDVARLRVRNDAGTLMLFQLGPGSSARTSIQRNGGEVEEVSVSAASRSAGLVIEHLKAAAGRVSRKTSTAFVSGVKRVDTILFDGRSIAREVRWSPAIGATMIAEYGEWQRELSQVSSSGARETLITRGEPSRHGWSSLTKGPGQPWAGFKYEAGGLAGEDGETHSTNSSTYDHGPVTSRFEGKSADGSVTWKASSSPTPASMKGDGTIVIHDHVEGESQTGYVRVDRETATNAQKGSQEVVTYWEAAVNKGPEAQGSYASGMQKVTTNVETGGVTVETQWKSQQGIGGGGENGRSTVATDGKGGTTGSYSISHDGNTEKGDWTTGNDGRSSGYKESTHSDGSSSRTAGSSDGQGNSSVSSVETHPDGSFTITTTSKGAGTDETTDKQEYDKDGNEKDATPAPSSEGDGPHGDDDGGNDHGDHGGGGSAGLPADDGQGGGGPSGGTPGPNMINALTGHGETPSADGADTGLEPEVPGPAGISFQNWLNGATPFQGGRSSSGSKLRGDPIGPIIDALASDGETDGDGSGGGQSGSGFQVDLRAVIKGEQDPENDPRAHFEALAMFAGITRDSASLRAAEQASKQLSS